MLSRGLYIAAGVWVVMALYWSWDAVSKIESNLHIRPVDRTSAIAGEQTLTWEFEAFQGKMARVWLIIHKNGDQRRPVSYQIELRSVDEDKVVKTKRIELKEKNFAQKRFSLDFNDIQFERGKTYRLQISSNEVESWNGIEFSLSKDLDPYNGCIVYENQVHEDTGINSLFLAEKIQIPQTLLIVGGVLLIALCLIAGNRPGTVYAVASIGSFAAIVLSIYYWEDRCWEYPFNFWPDGYARYAFEIKQWIVGEQSWDQTTAFLTNARNGQVFFVPLLVGAASALGLSLKLSFALVNLLFSLGTVALVGAWLRERFEKNFLLISIGLLALVSNIGFIRVAAALQTDVASLFFVTLFGWSCRRYLFADRFKGKIYWSVVIALSLVCGLLTRIALAPLILVPICYCIYDHFIIESRSVKKTWLINIPVVAAIMLLSIVWCGMGLWETFIDAFEFSRMEAFRSEYSIQKFINITIVVYPLLLLAVPLFIFKGLKDGNLIMCLGIIAGLLSLLYAGKIIPWVRYWAPAIGIYALFVIMTLDKWIKNDKWLAAILGGCVATQIIFFIVNQDLMAA